MTPTRSAFVRRSMAYKSLKKHIAAAEVIALKMLRHPTATNEQVMTIRESYRKTHAEAEQMRCQLKTKFPNWREAWNMDKGISG